MTEKTSSQLSRMLSKVAAKFVADEEPSVMTDLHIRVNQDTGDVMVYNDNDEELTRIVVDEWIENQEDTDQFYAQVAAELRRLLFTSTDNGVSLGMTFHIIMPYSFVLENEQGEHIEELFIADQDDDTIIVGEPFMNGLSEELDDFINNLLAKE